MPYIPKSWGLGSEPTDADFNHIEQGILTNENNIEAYKTSNVKSACRARPGSDASIDTNQTYVALTVLSPVVGVAGVFELSDGGVKINKTGNFVINLYAVFFGKAADFSIVHFGTSGLVNSTCGNQLTMDNADKWNVSLGTVFAATAGNIIKISFNSGSISNISVKYLYTNLVIQEV